MEVHSLLRTMGHGSLTVSQYLLVGIWWLFRIVWIICYYGLKWLLKVLRWILYVRYVRFVVILFTFHFLQSHGRIQRGWGLGWSPFPKCYRIFLTSGLGPHPPRQIYLDLPLNLQCISLKTLDTKFQHSGYVFNLRFCSPWFKPHQSLCVVSLGKILYLLLK